LVEGQVMLREDITAIARFVALNSNILTTYNDTTKEGREQR